MGFALPAAIGVKVARPEAEVWAVVGDGGFQMTMAELATIVRNTCRTPNAGSNASTFEVLTTPNTTQQRVFELLQQIQL